MNKWLSGCLLAALLTGVSHAQQVVMDTRKYYEPIDLSENQQTRILRETRAYDGVRPCEGGSVHDETPGSFTRAGAKQVAYLVIGLAPKVGRFRVETRLRSRVQHWLSLPVQGTD